MPLPPLPLSLGLTGFTPQRFFSFSFAIDSVDFFFSFPRFHHTRFTSPPFKPLTFIIMKFSVASAVSVAVAMGKSHTS